MQVLDMFTCDVKAEKKKAKRQPDTNIQYAIPHLVARKGIQPRWLLVLTDDELKEFQMLFRVMKLLKFFNAHKMDSILYPIYKATHSEIWRFIEPIRGEGGATISGAYLKDIAKI